MTHANDVVGGFVVHVVFKVGVAKGMYIVGNTEDCEGVGDDICGGGVEGV